MSHSPSFCEPEGFIASSHEASINDCIDAINAALIRAHAVTHMISVSQQQDADAVMPSSEIVVESLWAVKGCIDQAKSILGILCKKVRTQNVGETVGGDNE